MTLWLSTGEGTYHGMLQWGPGAAIRHAAFTLWLGRVTGLGSSPGAGLTLVTALPWLLGYLGLAGVGALVWITGRRPRLQPGQVYALGGEPQ